MDLLQLEHFLAVVEERTFTRAAERVVPDAAGDQPEHQEARREVGTPLFARDVHDVSLTEAGKVLVEYARKMVRRATMRCGSRGVEDTEDRHAEHRGARIGGGVPAPGAAARLSARGSPTSRSASIGAASPRSRGR